MRTQWWFQRFEAEEGDRGSEVGPPPSVVAARIAKKIGESSARAEEGEHLSTTDRVSHARAHDEADEARQRYLENRPGPHS